MEELHPISDILKSEAFSSFTRDPHPKRKDRTKKDGANKTGSQTSLELYTFLANLASATGEEKESTVRFVLASLFRAYRESPKLKGSALLGRLIRVFSNTLLDGGSESNCVAKKKLDADSEKTSDPDRSFSKETRDLVTAAFHDKLLENIQPDEALSNAFFIIFSNVITCKYAETRNNILFALLNFVKVDIQECTKYLLKCSPEIQIALTTLNEDLRLELESAQKSAALEAMQSYETLPAEELFKKICDDSKDDFQATLEKYVQENKKSTSLYPPVGTFLVELIKKIRNEHSERPTLNKLKFFLDCTYLIILDFLDEEKFLRGSKDKFTNSELISTLIFALAPVLLNEADQEQCVKDGAKKTFAGFGKFFDTKQRAQYLEQFKKILEIIAYRNHLPVPVRGDHLGNIFYKVLEEETPKELRAAILTALTTYHESISSSQPNFCGRDGYTDSPFVEAVVACNDVTIRQQFKSLSLVPPEVAGKIREKESQQAREQEQQAQRDEAGKQALLKRGPGILSRSSKGSSSPNLGKKKDSDDKQDEGSEKKKGFGLSRDSGKK